MSASLENVWNFKKVEVGARPKTHLNWVLTRTRYALLTTHAILTQNVITYYLQTHQPPNPLYPDQFQLLSFLERRNRFGSILFLLQNSCHFWTVEESVRIYFLCSSNPDIIAIQTLNSQGLLSLNTSTIVYP